MKRQAVTSSNIASIGYDERNEILEIEFRQGRVYQYFSVPKSVYQELMNASSHGKYHASKIKDKYRYAEI